MKVFTTLNKAKPNRGNKRGLKFGGNEAYDRSMPKLLLRGGADKSLARPTSLCHRTESIVSLERGLFMC